MKNLILTTLIFVSFSVLAQDEEFEPEAADTEISSEYVSDETTPAPEILAGPETTPKADTPVLSTETEVEINKDFEPRESHWLATFGGEMLNYPVPFEFEGVKQNIDPEDRPLWGGRLGFGGELYLGAGFLTSTRVEGYFVGTLFEKAKTADPELEDIEVSSIKENGQVYGLDVVQTLGYMFDLKTKNPFMDEWSYLHIEPFVEAGIGKAWAYNRTRYTHTLENESFQQAISDELTNMKLGVGVNITSGEGYFLYLRATQNRYNLDKRRSRGQQVNSGVTTSLDSSDTNVDIDPITVYALGGGYKW